METHCSENKCVGISNINERNSVNYIPMEQENLGLGSHSFKVFFHNVPNVVVPNFTF